MMLDIRQRKWAILIGLLFAAALVLTWAGCKGPTEEAPPPPRPPQEPYKVGAIFAITGDASSLGIPEKNTAEMLEKSINDAGGINGHPLEVIIEDSAGENAKARTAAMKLIEQDKVLAVIGPSRTGTTLAIVDLFEKNQLPLISCAAGIEIVQPPDQPVPKWVFKTPQSDRMAVEKIVDYLKLKKITRVATISDQTGFGKGGLRELKDLLPRNGIQIVGSQEYDPKAVDMTAQVTKLKGTNAQAVVCWGTPPGPAVAVKNMRQLGWDIPFIGSHGIANQRFIQVAGAAANGVVFPAGRLIVVDQIPATDPQRAVLEEYSKNYMDDYKQPADTFGGHAWDALQLLKQALGKVGGDSAKIRDEIEATKSFVGTGGVFNFSPTDHNGLTKEAFVMVEIKDGKWTLLK